MISTVTLAGTPGAPMLVVGPSLGTSVTALWGECARTLGRHFHVIGWDLPGHGGNTEGVTACSIPDLAHAVLAALDGPFVYAGDSVGGAVGLQLALLAPVRLRSVAALCTGAKIGERNAWLERAATVRATGTQAVIDSSRQRWFAPGFIDDHPQIAGSLLDSLAATDATSYAAVCEALADFDLREQLPTISTPILAIGGAHDIATPPDKQREIAAGVQNGRVSILPGIAHLAPAEAPDTVASLLKQHFLGID